MLSDSYAKLDPPPVVQDQSTSQCYGWHPENPNTLDVQQLWIFSVKSRQRIYRFRSFVTQLMGFQFFMSQWFTAFGLGSSLGLAICTPRCPRMSTIHGRRNIRWQDDIGLGSLQLETKQIRNRYYTYPKDQQLLWTCGLMWLDLACSVSGAEASESVGRQTVRVVKYLKAEFTWLTSNQHCKSLKSHHVYRVLQTRHKKTLSLSLFLTHATQQRELWKVSTVPWQRAQHDWSSWTTRDQNDSPASPPASPAKAEPSQPQVHSVSVYTEEMREMSMSTWPSLEMSRE